MIDRFLKSADPNSLAALIDRFIISLDYYVIWIVLVLLIFSLLLYIFKQTTFGASLAVLLISVAIILAFGIGGFSLYFFYLISVALLSYLNRHNDIYKEALDIQEKSGRKNFLETFSNGGVALILAFAYLINPSSLIIILFGATIAQIVSNTFAKEVGLLTRGKTVSILSGHPIKPGLSGGISIEGTVSSIIGAFLLSLLWYAVYFNPSIKTVSYVAILTLAGFGGSIIDSIVGDSFQVKYYDEEDKLYVEKEFKGKKRLPIVKGLKYINNDRVNFISNVFSIVFVALFYIIIS